MELKLNEVELREAVINYVGNMGLMVNTDDADVIIKAGRGETSGATAVLEVSLVSGKGLDKASPVQLELPYADTYKDKANPVSNSESTLDIDPVIEEDIEETAEDLSLEDSPLFAST